MTRPISSRTRALLDRLIRVDHAGELGAKYIYEGQLAVLKHTKSAPIIQQMLDGEKRHLKTFEELIPKNRVRPTALLPLFRIAAYGLGVATGLLGEKSAMACTVAVESVVGDHYNNQIRELLQEDPKAHTELLEILKQFRDEEMEHHDTGLANEAELNLLALGTAVVMPDVTGLDDVVNCTSPRVTIRGSSSGQFNQFTWPTTETEYRKFKNHLHVLTNCVEPSFESTPSPTPPMA
ncbi:ubiquinone biosynthesis monooxygenase Coq7 [Sparganum proliferum]